VEVKIKGIGEGRLRRASRTLSVPIALTSKSHLGSRRLVVTATCAAKWNTALALPMDFSTALALRISPISNWTSFPCFRCSHSKFRSTPGRERLSKRITLSPAESSRSARLVPINPEPPVISTGCKCAGWIVRSWSKFTLTLFIHSMPAREEDIPPQQLSPMFLVIRFRGAKSGDAGRQITHTAYPS
jgi:hypothetical protein